MPTGRPHIDLLAPPDDQLASTRSLKRDQDSRRSAADGLRKQLRRRSRRRRGFRTVGSVEPDHPVNMHDAAGDRADAAAVPRSLRVSLLHRGC